MALRAVDPLPVLIQLGRRCSCCYCCCCCCRRSGVCMHINRHVLPTNEPRTWLLALIIAISLRVFTVLGCRLVTKPRASVSSTPCSRALWSAYHLCVVSGLLAGCRVVPRPRPTAAPAPAPARQVPSQPQLAFTGRGQLHPKSR